MNFLLDTCLISELVRPRPDPGVVAWVSAQPEQRLFLSAITLGELRKGIARLPAGNKRTRLANWVESELKSRFSGRLLPIDEEVAERWGILTATAAAKGLAIPVLDGLIAATALVHGMTVVSRDLTHLQPTGALVFSPWSANLPQAKKR